MIKILLFLILFSNNIFADDSSFRYIELDEKISLEIPSHWMILSKDTKSNIVAAAESIYGSNNGVIRKKLLAVNATPSPTGAMISIAVSFSSSFTQDDLIKATDADLKSVQTDFINELKGLQDSGGITLIKMQSVRVERLNNKYALVLSYTRKGINNPEIPWQVELYRIPDAGRLIEVSLSYRLSSDSIMWKPILKRVKSSIKF